MDNNNSIDLSNMSYELRFLLEIIKTEIDDKELLENDKFTDINWNLFLKLVRHHRIYPLIYSKLSKLKEPSIPQHVMQALYQEFKTNTFQMLQLSGEMEHVSKLFTEHNIRLLFLKGPVIAHELYGDISLRTSKDLDILIPIGDLKKAETLLLSFGYYKEGNSEPILNEWKWKNHHVTYYHPKKQIQLEIHWKLQPGPSEPKFNKLWERRRESSIASYPVYFLGEEDLFFYLISHGARHGWFRLRWLIDIDYMVKKGIFIKKIDLIYNRSQYHHLGGQALILASQLLNTPIEEELKELTKGKLSEKLAQNAIESINGTDQLANLMSTKYYKKYLFSLKSSSQKLYFILTLFYPSSSDAKTLSLPKPLHFLYFPLRPFLWTWRKTRNSV